MESYTKGTHYWGVGVFYTLYFLIHCFFQTPGLFDYPIFNIIVGSSLRF